MWYPRKGTCLGPKKSEGFGEELGHRVVRASQLNLLQTPTRARGAGINLATLSMTMPGSSSLHRVSLLSCFFLVKGIIGRYESCPRSYVTLQMASCVGRSSEQSSSCPLRETGTHLSGISWTLGGRWHSGERLAVGCKS